MWSLSAADSSLLRPSTSTNVGLYAVMCWGLIVAIQRVSELHMCIERE